MKKVFLISAFLIFGCTNYFLFPDSYLYYQPNDITKFESHFIKSKSLPTLHGWLIPSEKGDHKKVVIHFHGNAQNISSHIASSYWLTESGFDLFIFDYRGYGLSKGEPKVSGAHIDAKRAVEYIRSLYGLDTCYILYGQSLGASILLAVAPELIKSNFKQAIVAESPFSSYSKIAAEKMRSLWITLPFSWLAYLVVSDHYSPEKYVNYLKDIDILYVGSKSDKVVPFHHTKKLFELSAGNKSFLISNNHPHLGSFQDKINRESLIKWINNSCK